MIQEFKFRFEELNIKRADIIATMGYSDNEIPEPFNTYLDSAFCFADKLDDIRASLRITDNVELLNETGTLVVDHTHFNIGDLLLKELRNSTSIAVFICTAGPEISTLAKELMFGEDPVKGFIYDILGSYISEAVGYQIEAFLKLQFKTSKLNITTRYSPGYVKWSLAEQEKLFALLEGKTCGVKLTPSSLMKPVKSISGVIGIGENVKYRKNRCALCNSKNCMFKRGKNQSGGTCINNIRSF